MTTINDLLLLDHAALVRLALELQRRVAQLEHENRLLWPLIDFRDLCMEGDESWRAKAAEVWRQRGSKQL